jgi:hypothetical protein
VLALVGIGGTGKTALVEQFLSELRSGELVPADGLFVWSFYEEPDADAFLQLVYQYFSGATASNVKGFGYFSLLPEPLGSGRRYLMVLDGLEKIQFNRHSGRHAFGEIEDSQLRAFLRQLATGIGLTKAIITTRFPVQDLARWGNGNYSSLDVDLLDAASAEDLLRASGVAGTTESLMSLVKTYGSHALTLDHLGTQINHFFGGLADRYPRAGDLGLGLNTQDRQLGAILTRYESLLSQREQVVLSSVCLFRTGVDLEMLDVVSNVGSRDIGPKPVLTRGDIQESLALLRQFHLVLYDSAGNYTVHPAVRDHFHSKYSDARKAHGAISQRLASLTQRPGQAFPQDRETLNLLEDHVFHLIAAERPEEARRIYMDRLGGFYHLAYVLGEYARGKRVLEQFPDPWSVDAEGWLRYLRGVGELPSDADWLKHKDQISHLSAHGFDDVQLLRGRLRGLRSSAASFFMGLSDTFHTSYEFAPRFSAFLAVAEVPGESKLECNEAVRDLLQADRERRAAGDYPKASSLIEKASAWILGSGSPEHLCSLSLVRSRLELEMERFALCRSTVTEGLFIARHCGFRLFEIDLLNQLSTLNWRTGSYTEAESNARHAQELAEEPFCNYLRGYAQAALNLARSHSLRMNNARAMVVLVQAETTISKRTGRIVGDLGAFASPGSPRVPRHRQF